MPKKNISQLNSEALFAYAIEFAGKQSGMGELYPSFRQVAKRFNCTYDQIEEACDAWDNSNGYMQPAVGGATGGGYFAYEHRGDYLVEAYR